MSMYEFDESMSLVSELTIERDAALRMRQVQLERADRLQAQLDAVETVIEHARKISPSPSMHVYVADLERALGRDAATPHKLGGSDEELLP